MIEVEKRYKVLKLDEMLALLDGAGMQQVQQNHVVDEWYAPLDVQSHERQEEWFDKEHGIAYRIRRVEQKDESFTLEIETKQLTEANNHDTFKEERLSFATYDEARRYIEDLGYWNWLTIDKTRYKFDSHDTEVDVVLDYVAGLAEKIGVGAALEIEYQGDAERGEALKKLAGFATRLGLSDEQLFAKSFTVEAMQALAKFN